MALTMNAARLKKIEAAEKLKSQQKTAAVRQAHKDALVKPKPPARTTKIGAQATLAELNHQQREQDAGMRDEAREASLAAARAVNGVLTKTTIGSVRLNRRAMNPKGPNTAAMNTPEAQAAVKASKQPKRRKPSKK